MPAAPSSLARLDPDRGGVLARILKSRRLAWFLARIGIVVGRWWGRPFRLGEIVLVIRHRDIETVLSHDLDYLIAPVNGPRFTELGFPFILGMDRTQILASERASLYSALDAIDFEPMRTAAADDVAARLAGHGGSIDFIEDLARPVAAATAGRLVGLAMVPADLMAMSRPLFEHSFLNQQNDRKVAAVAHQAAAMLSDALSAAIKARRAQGNFGNSLLDRLLQVGAGVDLTRRTLAGIFVGAIDTTATAAAKSLWVLASRRVWLDAATRDRDDPDRLYGWCCDAMRRWTHVPIISRQAVGSSAIGGTAIDDGAKIIMWTQAAMADVEAFLDPGTLRPDRPQRRYLHLGGGLHPCAGRAINAWQVPLLVGSVLGEGVRKVAVPAWSGPFPDSMRLTLAGSAA